MESPEKPPSQIVDELPLLNIEIPVGEEVEGDISQLIAELGLAEKEH